MDELLFERIEQLKEIDERLERMLLLNSDFLHKAIRDLRNDLALMIRTAQEGHAAF